jgi:hypothetical protein
MICVSGTRPCIGVGRVEASTLECVGGVCETTPTFEWRSFWRDRVARRAKTTTRVASDCRRAIEFRAGDKARWSYCIVWESWFESVTEQTAT